MRFKKQKFEDVPLMMTGMAFEVGAAPMMADMTLEGEANLGYFVDSDESNEENEMVLNYDEIKSRISDEDKKIKESSSKKN